MLPHSCKRVAVLLVTESTVGAGKKKKAVAVISMPFVSQTCWWTFDLLSSWPEP